MLVATIETSIFHVNNNSLTGPLIIGLLRNGPQDGSIYEEEQDSDVKALVRTVTW